MIEKELKQANTVPNKGQALHDCKFHDLKSLSAQQYIAVVIEIMVET